MSDEASVEDAKTRAGTAKPREIEAHRRAIKMHQDAVILFDWLYQTGKTAKAPERAERARPMLRQALVEQAEARERSGTNPATDGRGGSAWSSEPPLRWASADSPV